MGFNVAPQRENDLGRHASQMMAARTDGPVQTGVRVTYSVLSVDALMVMP